MHKQQNISKHHVFYENMDPVLNGVKISFMFVSGLKNRFVTVTRKCTNKWKFKISNDELNILKFGLSYRIPPKSVNRTDVFAYFDMISIE